MKPYIEHAVTLYSAFKSAFGLHQKVTGPSKLPPELERQIFETCALENPEVCPVLLLVARRVYLWSVGYDDYTGVCFAQREF